MKKAMQITCLLFLLHSIATITCTSAAGTGRIEASESRQNVQLPVFAMDASRGLSVMLREVKDRKVFLLGDATHGTEEFYAFRKRVTRHLIRDMGVRVVVLEAEWDGGRMVDDYIRGLLPASVSARQMLAEAFVYWPSWVWANEEMVEFVQWLKDFNSSQPPGQMVRCHGMDMQFAIATALAELQGVWPEGSRQQRVFEDLSRWWRPYQDYPMAYNFAYAEGRETGNLLATELLATLPIQEKGLRRVVRMLIGVEEYYRVMSRNQYEAWNIRSRHFADYIEDLLGEPEGAKGVVAWAHNSHVGDMSAADVQDTGLTSLGQLMRERLGREEVFILGSAGYAGTVLASPEWYEPPRVMHVPPAADGSLEEILERGGWDNSLLFFADDEQVKKWSTPMLHRGIGVAYDPKAEMPSYYVKAKMSSRYDALVFWRSTRALQPMVAP